LIQKMLSKEPERRPQRGRDVGVALASLVPAIPPHVPSGADILKKVAPEFAMEASPYDGTLRNKGDGLHATPAASSWTPSATRIPALPTGNPRSPFETDPSERGAVAVPTVNERVAAAFAAPVAPLATPIAPASAFDRSSEAPRAASSWTAGRTIALGLGCALLVGTTTFLVASMRHHAHATSAPQDASALATGGGAPTSQPAPSPANDAAVAITPIQASVAAPNASPPTSPVDAGVMTAPKRVRPSDHATPTHHGAEHSAASAGSASGSASAPTAPKKFNPDAIEE
jgi:hypothetical protein